MHYHQEDRMQAVPWASHGKLMLVSVLKTLTRVLPQSMTKLLFGGAGFRNMWSCVLLPRYLSRWLGLLEWSPFGLLSEGPVVAGTPSFTSSGTQHRCSHLQKGKSSFNTAGPPLLHIISEAACLAWSDFIIVSTLLFNWQCSVFFLGGT